MPLTRAMSVPGVWRSQRRAYFTRSMLAGFDDDQVFILQARRPLDAGRDHRMVFVGVGADHQDAIGIFQFADGIGHRSGTERRGQPGHGGAVSETGAVIDVIGADPGAQQLLHQVIFFVGGPGGGPAADLFGAVLLFDFLQAGGHEVQGLIPGGLLELAAFLFAEQRLFAGGPHVAQSPGRSGP